MLLPVKSIHFMSGSYSGFSIRQFGSYLPYLSQLFLTFLHFLFTFYKIQHNLNEIFNLVEFNLYLKLIYSIIQLHLKIIVKSFLITLGLSILKNFFFVFLFLNNGRIASCCGQFQMWHPHTESWPEKEDVEIT
jgi:hypothetical protein